MFLIESLKRRVNLPYASIALLLAISLIPLFIYNERLYLIERNQPHLLTIARMLVMLSVAVGSYGALCKLRGYVVKGVPPGDRTFLTFFGLSVATFGFWLLGLWPGVVASDSISTIQQARILQLDMWFSYLNPLLNLMIYQVYPNAAGMTVFQVLLTSAVIASIFSYLAAAELPKPLLWGTALLILTSAAVASTTMILSRDTIFGVLHLALAFDAFRLVLKRAPLTWWLVLRMTTLVVILSIYRGDGIPLLVLLPLALLIGKAISLVQALRLAGLAVVSFFLINSTAPHILKATPTDIGYSLTLVMNPLGYILQRDHHSADPVGERQVLEKVIDVNKVIEVSHPYEIPGYWGGHWNWRATKEEVAQFHEVYVQLVANNVPLFLTNRLLNFRASLGLSEHGYLTFQPREASGNWTNNWLSIPREPLVPALASIQERWLTMSTKFHGFTPSGRFLHWNVVPALLLAVLALCLFKWIPATAIAAALILYRVPMIFLTAPASQFKYYYSLYLFGFFVLAMGVLEYRLKCQQSRLTEGDLPPRLGG